MKVRKQLTERQRLFGLMLRDQAMFMRHFWSDEITLPPSTRQKMFWNDVSKRVLLATGRKTSKTLSIEARIVRKSISYRKHTRLSERMFAAPGEQQLQPTLQRLHSKIQANPLFRVLVASSNKNDGILKWHTNVIYHWRIDGTAGDDRNMVGLRLDEIIFDEAAFTVRACHSSRKQSALPGCEWLYAGVPNSVRNTVFHELDQTSAGRGWSHHKFSTYTNPLYWSQAQRNLLQEDYSPGSPDYTTQVMGAWGVELFSSFPPDAMLVNEHVPYRVISLDPMDIPRNFDTDTLTQTRLAAKLRLPQVNAAQYIIGMDYGYHQDPTEIGVAYRESLESCDWQMLCRIHVVGADPLAQARLLYFLGELIGRERIGRVCIDLANSGVTVALELSQQPAVGQWWQAMIIDLASGGMVEITDPLDPEGIKKIKVRRKQWLTQELQAALLAARANLPTRGKPRLVLGKDEDLVQELIDTREQKMASGYIVYIGRSLGKHKMLDHATDMLRAITAAALEAQEELGDEVAESEAMWAGANPFKLPINY